MSGRNRGVVSVIGRDQKGVVARVSTYLASCNANIEDTEQRVMEGLFIMTMLVDLNDVSTTQKMGKRMVASAPQRVMRARVLPVPAMISLPEYRCCAQARATAGP